MDNIKTDSVSIDIRIGNELKYVKHPYLSTPCMLRNLRHLEGEQHYLWLEKNGTYTTPADNTLITQKVIENYLENLLAKFLTVFFFFRQELVMPKNYLRK